jgi:Tfp pilus assembly protein PilF
MRLAALPATILLAALAASPAARAAPGEDPGPAPARRLTPAEVSRGFSDVDDAARRGALGEQRSHWLAASAASPRDPGARVLAAYALPHGDDCWAELQYLSEQFQDSAIPWVAMWRIYLEWGVLDQIDRSLPAARRAEPGSWLVGLVEAMLAERRGQASQASAGYRAVLARDRDNVDAWAGLARLARAGGDDEVARPQPQGALGRQPGHAPALRVLAEQAEAQGDGAGALARYQQVVAADPRDRPTRVKLARLLEQQGDAAAARDQWKAALAIREDAEALVALAEAARRCGDAATEQRALERLSALAPGSAEWRRIAEIRLQAQDLDGAERALRQAISREPGEARNQLALGRLLAGSGRLSAGLEHLREAGEAGSADREAAERRINLQRLTTPDPAALKQAVGALIDTTYRRRLLALPRLAGKLTIRVTTDASGRAALVEVQEDTLHDDDVRACAYWNLKDAAYPASKPGRYSFSYTLRPGR